MVRKSHINLFKSIAVRVHCKTTTTTTNKTPLIYGMMLSAVVARLSYKYGFYHIYVIRINMVQVKDDNQSCYLLMLSSYGC